MGYLDKTEFQYVWDTINKRFVRLEGSKITDEAQYLFRETASEEKDIISPIGEIKSIKGNTIKWNQLFDINGDNRFDNSTGTKDTTNNSYIFTVKKISESSSQCRIRTAYSKGIIGHKYLATVKSRYITNQNNTDIWFYVSDSAGYNYFTKSLTSTSTEYNAIFTSEYGSVLCIGTNSGASLVDGDQFEIKDFNIFDLTLMFGAGNEPTTVEEFRAMFPNPYYEYNTGELKSVSVTGIKTVGFNAFDGELEVGGLDSTTGAELLWTNAIRSKNFIKVLPNTQYTFYDKNLRDNGFTSNYIFCYDKDFNKVSGGGSVKYNNYWIITTGSQTQYIRLFAGYVDNPSTDIEVCFHLTHTGYKNGTYEPYWTETRYIDNALELRSAGSAYDELTKDKKITRIGVVDLGTLNWSKETKEVEGVIHAFYKSSLKSGVGKSGKANILCLKYETGTFFECRWIDYLSSTSFRGEKSIISLYNSNHVLTIFDKDFDNDTATIDQFVEALSGVLFYYELVDPIEEEFDIPLDLTYRCEDFGTEEILLAEGSIVPPTVVTEYTHNFLDFTRRLHDLYVAKSNIKTINGSSIIGKGNLDIVPTCPSEDGTYILKATVTNGVATLTWVKEE